MVPVLRKTCGRDASNISSSKNGNSGHVSTIVEPAASSLVAPIAELQEPVEPEPVDSAILLDESLEALGHVHARIVSGLEA